MLVYPVLKRNALSSHWHGPTNRREVSTVMAKRTPVSLNPTLLHDAIYKSNQDDALTLARKCVAIESLLALESRERRDLPALPLQEQVTEKKACGRNGLKERSHTLTDVWHASSSVRTAILSNLQPEDYTVVEGIGRSFRNEMWTDAARMVDHNFEEYRSMLHTNQKMRLKRFVFEKLRIGNARYYCMFCDSCLSQKSGHGNGDYNCVGCDDCAEKDPYGFACIKCIEMEPDTFKKLNTRKGKFPRTYYCNVHRCDHVDWHPWWKPTRTTRNVRIKSNDVYHPA